MANLITRTRLWTLFRDMVDLYSPSGKEEALTALLEDRLQGRGLKIERQPVDEFRSNLLLSSGRGEPDTLFLGHIDTVPAYDIEACGFSERDGLCYGVGTADMKSGCAAMIEAFVSAAEQGALSDRVLLALVVGEEETGDGTQALLSSRSFQTAVVGEPTNMQPCLEHYGYVELVVRAFGYRRHAAMSDRDTNAIHAMLRFLIQLEDRIEQEEPDTVLNIRDLHSSESGFAVPDRCAVAIDLHLPPGINAREYASKLDLFIESVLGKSRASRYETSFPTQADGFRIAAENSLAQEVHRVFGVLGMDWAPIAFRSHSDANLLRDDGCQPLILGPGLLAKAHTRDESVDFEQVATAAEIYTRLIRG